MNNLNQINQGQTEHNKTNNVVPFKSHEQLNIELLKSICTQINNGGDSVKLLNNMYEKFPDHKNDINEYVKTNTHMTKPQINNIFKNHIKNEQYKNEPETLNKWIANYFEQNKTNVSASNVIMPYGKFVFDQTKTDNQNLIARALHKTKNDNGLKIFIDKMWSKLHDNGLDEKYKCDNKHFNREFEIVRSDLSSKKRNAILESVLTERPEFPWNEWKRVACIISDDNADYVAALLYHHIWMTKRRMVGLPITHHTMPIFYGTQGSGKSFFVDIFTKPLDELTAPSTWKDVLGKKEHDLYTKYFVLFLDEMVGTGSTDIDAMKTFLTSKYQTGRPMYTNSTEQMEINPTIIATTNQPVRDLVRDPTGNRRFAEIGYGTERYPTPYKNPEFDKINWLDMWRSVDPNADSIFIRDENLYELVFNGVMREKSYRSPFVQFMNERYVNITINHEYSADALYEHFISFYENGNFNRDQMDISKFKNQIGKFITSNPDQTGFVRKVGHARKTTYVWGNDPDMYNYGKFKIVGNGV
jgi:hypothetical protein